MGYVIAILVVIAAGWGLLVGRRRWLERRDAERTAATGGAWQFCYELPLLPGPPYSYFGALTLSRPFDTRMGTDEGFQVAYFTVGEIRGSGRAPRKRPAAIVEVPEEMPNFTYSSIDIDPSAPARLSALRQHTPPHDVDTHTEASNSILALSHSKVPVATIGRAGRLGPLAAEVLERSRSVNVTTARFAVLVISKGARREEVQQLALALAKALVADARNSSPPA